MAKPATYPAEDEKTDDGSIILWSRLTRIQKKLPRCHSKKRWHFTQPVVPVICGSCQSEFVMSVTMYRSGQRHTTLCRACSVDHPPSGPNHIEWKGGRTVRQDGYIAITFSALSPDAQRLFASMVYGNRNCTGKVMEHRLQMARHLGRPLERNEHVHHLNGNKQDNRIENLQLVSPSQHAELELVIARAEIARLKAILDENHISYDTTLVSK